jgi:hypothetical protein
VSQDVTVLFPPVVAGGVELYFFCDLARENAAREVVATMQTWCRLHKLGDEEAGRLGIDGEDAWYDLARAWMQDAQSALTSWTACARALAEAREPLERMGSAGRAVQNYLATFGWTQFPPAR